MITNIKGEAEIVLPPPLPEKVRSSGGGSPASTPTPPVETQSPIIRLRVDNSPIISLRVDNITHEVIAEIRDRETNKVIGEIPPEEMRTASRVIRSLLGQLVDKLA